MFGRATIRLGIGPHSSSVKIAVQRSRTVARSAFFSQRVVTSWNKLPDEVVNATSIRPNMFKNRLDQCNEWGNWKTSVYEARLHQVSSIKYQVLMFTGVGTLDTLLCMDTYIAMRSLLTMMIIHTWTRHQGEEMGDDALFCWIFIRHESKRNKPLYSSSWLHRVNSDQFSKFFALWDSL